MRANTMMQEVEIAENLPENADFGTINFDNAEYHFYRKKGQFYLNRELRDGTENAEISVDRIYREMDQTYHWIVLGMNMPSLGSLRSNYYTPRELSLKLDSKVRNGKE